MKKLVVSPSTAHSPDQADQRDQLDLALAGDHAAHDHVVSPGATSPTNAPVSRNASSPTRT